MSSPTTLGNASAIQGILIPRLRRGQDVEAIDPFVLDQSLVQAGIPVDHIDEIENDPALAAHDQIEITQPYVEIDDGGFETLQGQPGTEGCGGGGLTNTAFTRSHNDDSGQFLTSQCWETNRQTSFSMTIVSFWHPICTGCPKNCCSISSFTK